MKTTLYLTALLVSLLLGGCKPRESTVSGQAFILTGDGEKTKLGRIEVRLIEKTPAKEFIQKKLPAIEAEMALRQSNFSALKSECEKAEANCSAFLTNNPTTTPNFLALKEQRKALQEDYCVQYLRKCFDTKTNEFQKLLDKLMETKAAADLAKANGEEDAPYAAATVEALNATEEYKRDLKEWLSKARPIIAENKTKIDQLSGEIAKIEAAARAQAKPFLDQLATAKTRFEAAKATSQNPYPKAEDYFSDFSPAVFEKTTTDTNGNFSFSYPQDKSLAIFAKAERPVGGKTERYYWLVNAPSGVEKTRLFLSNSNLVWVDADGFFKIKPKPDL